MYVLIESVLKSMEYGVRTAFAPEPEPVCLSRLSDTSTVLLGYQESVKYRCVHSAAVQ